ncbi:MAG: PPC domain-containing protein [Lachnospiraceae bacterium]|nr:PPC domain-containing protein [Lachnospiraceae bacterium]
MNRKVKGFLILSLVLSAILMSITVLFIAPRARALGIKDSAASDQPRDNDPNYPYAYVENAPIQYTYRTSLSLTAGETITVSTAKATSHSNSDTVIHLFYSSNPTASNSWANDDYNGTVFSRISVTVPTTGSYTLLVRCYGNTTGYCNVYKNGALLAENAQLGGYKLLCLGYSGTRNFFTSNSVGVDTILYVMDASHRVLAKSDDYGYNGEPVYGDFNWGNHSRVHKNLNGQQSYVFVSAYNSTNIGTADIYSDCSDGYANISDFPNLKAIDSIKSGPSTNVYNCIAWSGGITSRWINPFYAPESNPYYLSFMEPWYNANPLVAFDNFYGNNPQRYAGATTYVSTSISSSSIVDLYTLNAQWQHASVKKPGNAVPHGYAWESKLGESERIFHPRNSLEGGAYGSIGRYYMIASREQELSFEESVNSGATREIFVSIDDREEGELQRNLATISDDLLSRFDDAYSIWVDAARNSSMGINDGNLWLTQLVEFGTLKNLVDENSELVFAVINKYRQDTNLLSRTLFEAAVVSRNSKTLSLANDVREENNEISRASLNKAVYYAPSFEANAQTFIKRFLQKPEEYLTGDGSEVDPGSVVSERCDDFYRVIAGITDEEFVLYRDAYDAWVSDIQVLSSTREYLNPESYSALKNLIESNIKYKYLLVDRTLSMQEYELSGGVLVSELIVKNDERYLNLLSKMTMKEMLQLMRKSPEEYIN